MSKAKSSIPDDGNVYSLPLWARPSKVTMLGFRPRPFDHSGPDAMWPWIECGEPMAEDVAEGPDAVE